MVVAAREHAFRRLRYELIGWAEAALALDGAAAHPLGAAAWGIVAYGRFVRGEITAAVELGERSLELARVHGTETLGLAERALANACVFRRDRDGAKAATLALIEVAVASGDEARVAHAHYMGSLSETSSGGRETGRAYAERAQVAAARCGNPTAMAQAAYATGIWLATAPPGRGPGRAGAQRGRWPATWATCGSSCSPAPRRCGCGPATVSPARRWRGSRR